MNDLTSVALAHLFDDAGLFPPAGKELEVAVRDHRDYLQSPEGWMVGRFLLPTSQLGPFEAMQRPSEDWELSVVAEHRLDDGYAAIAPELIELARMAEILSIRGFEVRLPTRAPRPGDLDELLQQFAAIDLPKPVEIWLEVPVRDVDGTRGWLAAIAAQRTLPASVAEIGAKIRCGGLEPAAFPSVAQLIDFLDAAETAGVAFKATAGLHHPFPTPEPKIGVLQHGFLGLLAATGLSGSGRLAALTVTADEAELGEDELRLGGERIDADGLRSARERFVAIGSCSFTEPVEDLLALGMLGRSANTLDTVR